MDERTAARHLAGAELWVAGYDEGGRGEPGDAGQRDVDRDERPGHARPVFVAGWEDGEPFCATVCSTDVGLAFCRRCPEHVVEQTLRTGRPGHDVCGAGVRLLAFPAPQGSRRTAAVLRVGPPKPKQAAAVAAQTRVAPDALRRAARQAGRPDARGALAAARLLRTPNGLLVWQSHQRSRGSDRRRTATAALAQMIATSEEYHELYRASQQQGKELERNQRRLDKLARQTVRASDQERARIAHQIHDTAAQSMVSAFRFLDAARASMPAAGTEAPAASQKIATAGTYLDSASERLVTAIAEVRSVLAHLVPPGLEELGLAHAIQSRMRLLAAETGLEVELTGDLPRLDPWVEQTLYGMTSEAMTNAIRHARASSLHVVLAEFRGRAVVTVQDDGQGFKMDAPGRRAGGHGLGLLGIARQASWLGGRATIRSRPGAGCTVRISVPLARHRASGGQGATAPTAPTPVSDPADPAERASARLRPGPSGRRQASEPVSRLRSSARP